MGTRSVAAVGMSALAIAATAAVGSSAGPTGSADAEPERPNVVLVTLDDARVDDMRFMPNVQRLVKGPGAVFPNAFLSDPLCVPARASILTGQYAHNHGVRHVEYPAGSYRKWIETGADQSTLPLWLQQSGYHTVMLGKYLNGYEGYSRERFGSGNAQKDPGWSSWKASVRTYDYQGLAIRHRPGTFRAYTGRYATHVINDLAAGVVRNQASSLKPFFLWVSHLAPHHGSPHEADDPAKLPTPYVFKRDRGTFAHLGNVTSPAFDEADVSDKPSTIRRFARIDKNLAAQIKETRQQRVESLQAVDRGVGRLVGALRETGQLRNTFFILTSDNGYSLGEHRRPHGKVLPYREAQTTPLYIRGPGIPADRVVRQQVSMSIDMAPTVLSMAKVRPPRELDGVSLYNMIRDPGPSTRPLLLETWNPDGTPLYSGLRGPRYQYVEYPGTGEVELYDLRRDPHQLRSLHADPDYLTTRIQLAARLAVTRACVGSDCR
ncbi:MAG: sulfatase-like hydrolase/transferase [Actinophytocola sp.]|nr:sulfatase-like hydrolase/transferase [Actinophytocola sp.]